MGYIAGERFEGFEEVEHTAARVGGFCWRLRAQNWPAFDVHLREVVLKGNLTQSSVVSCVGVEEEP
jgi:hypothetical protein